MKALRQRMAELPGFDIAQFDKLEDHALGLMYVQARYIMATQPPSDLAELIEEAERLRTWLLADARALAVRGYLDGRKLDALKGGGSSKGVAQDLLALAAELEAIFPTIQGKSTTTAEELKTATQTATRLTRLVGERDQSPALVAELAQERLRGFTQLLRTYDDARAALAFLRRVEGDADEIAPNLYTANTKRRRPTEPGETDETTAAQPAATPVALPSNATPVAAPAGSTSPFGP